MQILCQQSHLTWGKQLGLLGGGGGEELPLGEHLEQRRHARRRRLLPLGDRQAAAAVRRGGGRGPASPHASAPTRKEETEIQTRFFTSLVASTTHARSS